MSGFSPDTIELLERAQRAIEEAERLRAERKRLASGIARQQGHIVDASLLRNQSLGLKPGRRT